MLHKQIHFRKYRCPWCGGEIISLSEKVIVQSRRRHSRFGLCDRCGEQYGQQHGISVWAPFILSLLLFSVLVITGQELWNKGYVFVTVLLFIGTIAVPEGLFFIYNYLFAQLVRIKQDSYVPFTYQGYMEITPVDKKVRRFIKDGAILAVRYVSHSFRPSWQAGEDDDKEKTEFPIVLSDNIQAYKPGLWEWGYLNPEKVPDELFQEGREVVIIDNGREVAKGLVTSVFEDFEKDEPAEDAE